MADNKMLIDTAHPEETRVAMVRGNRVDEFDFESEHKTQLRGNIYLAKVTRVEPSLQAAFVDYGGNRHGFLAFSEIHPDYYQIPIADRQALLAAEEAEVRSAAEEETADDDAKSDENDDQGTTETEAGSEEAPKPARKRRSSRRTKKAPVDEADAADKNAEPSEDKTSKGKTKAKAKTEAVPEESDDDADEIGADNEGDDVVSEEVAAEPVKKPRKRASRAKKKTADKEAEASKDDSDTEDAPAAKPRRRTTRRKKADDQASADSEAKPVEDSKEDEGSKESIIEAEAASEEKPRRRSTRRKKAPLPEKNEEETVSDSESAPESSEDTEEPDRKEKREKKTRSRGRGRAKRNKGRPDDDADIEDADANGDNVEELGSDDAMEEVPTRRASRRHYKIQEVIKRRQILLVQVVKEERGNKGAALTTYLSLAGRYSVLMPNTARGGGISRKITNASDRKRLKSIASSFDVPQGMGVILRTAGASRKPEEIQRDFEYLMRLWESVRTLTLESTAPCLVYEEGSLIKRSIRDLYDNDTREILVAGEAGHKEAKDFMSMLMPEHAPKVKLYKDRVPLFAKMGVETQLDAMLQPQVTLKSGGYIIIDQTEALVSIDVNSGKSTRQHSIEETATKTNLEASDEIARQLRLRDLAGLIVIDFIDMDERRNNRAVEKRLKDALKHDRARIQVGRISHFGLLEMSRQRIRASVLESTTQVCPTCEGLGHVRSPSSVALAVLRAIEEQLNRNSRNNLTIKVSTTTALYLLNNKRENLSDLEQRFGVRLVVETDNTIGNVPCLIERGEQSTREAMPETAVQPDTIDPGENGTTTDTENDANSEESSNGARKKRRRRRRGKSSEQNADKEQSAEASDESPATDQEEKADKPPRSRRSRRKNSDETASNSGDSEEVAVVPDMQIEDSSAAKEVPPAKEKPKRATRRRKAQVSQSTSDEPEQAVVEEAIATDAASETVSEEEPKKPRRSTRRKKAPVRDATTAPETKSTKTSTPDQTSGAAPATEEPTDKTDKSEKTGWWKRKFF